MEQVSRQMKMEQHEKRNPFAMKERIELKYINEVMQVGLVDIKQVYLLTPFISLMPEVYKGKLVYRAKGSTKRISYDQIKKGLVKRKKIIEIDVPNWIMR